MPDIFLGLSYEYAGYYDTVGDIWDKFPVVYGSESSPSVVVRLPSQGATSRWSQHNAAVYGESGLIFYAARVLSDME
jgi:hypothetical protein